jgi:hypothetical protein
MLISTHPTDFPDDETFIGFMEVRSYAIDPEFSKEQLARIAFLAGADMTELPPVSEVNHLCMLARKNMMMLDKQEGRDHSIRKYHHLWIIEK